MHHPSEATLLACSAGTLPEPHRRVVAVHLAQCRHCGGLLRRAEAIGGVWLEDMPPATLEPGALDRTLARLDRAAPPEPPAAPLTLQTLQQGGRWRRLAPGIAMLPLLPRDATDSRLDLFRVAPGKALLEHGHAGPETTCVLQGGFEDGHATYRTGDLSESDGALDHQPRALAGPDCICLVATTGRLRPQSWLGRLVRPLLDL